MTPEDLLVVTCYFNPIQYASRTKHHNNFVKHMEESGVRLIVVECQLGERDFVVTDRKNPNHVQVRSSTLVWNKENLINIGVNHGMRLYPDTGYICWSDADVTMRRQDWAMATLHALQQYEVVQPWSHCYDLGPNGEHTNVDESLAYHWHHHQTHRGPYGGFRHTGYIWAIRRATLERLGGLMDFAALGAADHHMALALLGKADESVPRQMSASYRNRLKAWEDRALQHVAYNFGYVHGTIEHAFHGKKKDRRYVDRWQILIRNNFDPDIDLKKNLYGVVELAGNKPKLRHEMDRYFRQRNEDINTLQ